MVKSQELYQEELYKGSSASKNQYCLGLNLDNWQDYPAYDPYAPMSVESPCWTNCLCPNPVSACYLALLEGCMTEDSALMTLDLASLAAGLDHRRVSQPLKRVGARLGGTQPTLSPLGSCTMWICRERIKKDNQKYPLQFCGCAALHDA
jgi:hypothetical protein